MLPRPAIPASKPVSQWSLRVPRDAAITLLRNNLFALGGLFLFNWLFPIYAQLKKALLPSSWLNLFYKIELAVLMLAFGLNILVALVSLRYPRAPFPPVRTPSKPTTTVTPVRRPHRRLTDFGSPLASRPSAKSLATSSGYASTPLSSTSRVLNYSVPSSVGVGAAAGGGTPFTPSRAASSSPLSSSSLSSSFNASPLAAYRGRHTARSGRPIDTRLLDSLTAADENTSF